MVKPPDPTARGGGRTASDQERRRNEAEVSLPLSRQLAERPPHRTERLRREVGAVPGHYVQVTADGIPFLCCDAPLYNVLVILTL